jgi:hypothetical protein
VPTVLPGYIATDINVGPPRPFNRRPGHRVERALTAAIEREPVRA